ncbi:MAG: DNA polymerase IV [Deltaproteobacteria bacterium]|nr:DNA polymerase IV [Deltaproteobacteria bacterium]MBW1922102.1 DNA polymerase IV [Deltaproteobacteria bacterium]MBW2102400.1 DNA polymerase IV [Deltaproteobacteria bacterium]RLB33068.1 MAG: DNA polymerase IV [Deltaproteobacteria bacterium]
MTVQPRERRIIHMDMDAFYAAVETLDRPEIKGRPVIVGGSSRRGVVSSASYEARAYGIHSAQPIATAKRLCPDGVFLPVRMRRYQEVSSRIMEIFGRFTPLVEPVSIDEAFLDVTGSERLFGSVVEIAGALKKLVLEETGLTVSAGVAPNKFLAKIASDMDKPDGLTVVEPGMVAAFLDPLPIDRLWGVGEATRRTLTGTLGVRRIGDLKRLPRGLLERRFGKLGLRLYDLARGRDEREVVPGHEVKSIGHERTYPEDILDPDRARREILYLADLVARRLRRKGFSGKTVTLKVKYADFTLRTRSSTLALGTDDAREIYAACLALLPRTEVGRRPLRLLGVSVSNLEREMDRQLALFQDERRLKKRRLNLATDRVQEKFGDRVIGPGSLLEKDE